VARSNSARRARARKRRPAPPGGGVADGEQIASGAQATLRAEGPPRAPTRAAARRAAAAERSRAANARPQAPWHPLPLSELLILAGAIAAVLAWRDGIAGHALLLGVGLAAIALGTLEVTLREHLAGYRSHTVLLAVIPPIALHSAVILALVAFIRVPRWVNLPLLAIDVALFALLFKALRARYLDAQRERRFAAGAR